MTDTIENAKPKFIDHDDVVVSLLKTSSQENIAFFLQEALDSGDTAHFARCVGQVAQSIGMSEIARRTGMKRPALYRLTDGRSKPRLDTILKVVKAVGVDMRIAA